VFITLVFRFLQGVAHSGPWWGVLHIDQLEGHEETRCPLVVDLEDFAGLMSALRDPNHRANCNDKGSGSHQFRLPTPEINNLPGVADAWTTP
jgi:hypothetical protein